MCQEILLFSGLKQCGTLSVPIMLLLSLLLVVNTTQASVCLEPFHCRAVSHAYAFNHRLFCSSMALCADSRIMACTTPRSLGQTQQEILGSCRWDVVGRRGRKVWGQVQLAAMCAGGSFLIPRLDDPWHMAAPCSQHHDVNPHSLCHVHRLRFESGGSCHQPCIIAVGLQLAQPDRRVCQPVPSLDSDRGQQRWQQQQHGVCGGLWGGRAHQDSTPPAAAVQVRATGAQTMGSSTDTSTNAKLTCATEFTLLPAFCLLR